MSIAVSTDSFSKYVDLFKFPTDLRNRVYSQWEDLELKRQRINETIKAKVIDCNCKIEEFYSRFT